MYIQEDKLVIRNAEVKDTSVICKWWNDGKVMEHAGFPNGLDIKVDDIINQISTDSDDVKRLLILEVDNVLIGEMNYRNKGNNIAEIGIKICEFKQQEKGYGTRFLRMLINELLANRGYTKIVLDTNLNNKRSQYVYEKLGFRKVDIKMNSWKNQLGELQSTVYYELIKF